MLYFKGRCFSLLLGVDNILNEKKKIKTDAVFSFLVFLACLVSVEA